MHFLVATIPKTGWNILTRLLLNKCSDVKLEYLPPKFSGVEDYDSWKRKHFTEYSSKLHLV